MASNIFFDQIMSEVSDSQRDAFQPVSLAPGRELNWSGHIPHHVFFLRNGIAQGFVRIGEQEAGGPLLGRDSVIGEAAALGFFPSGVTTAMLVAGEGHCVAASALFAMADEVPAVRTILTGAVWSALRAAQRDAARVHRLSKAAYLANLLLLAGDLLDSPTVPLTHEALARSICSHRPLVTVALQALEQRDLIRNARGRVEIRDRLGLAEVADGRAVIKTLEAA